MIPIRINLVSPEKRQIHREVVYIQFIKNVAELLLITVALASALLMSGLTIVEDGYNDLTSGEVLSGSKHIKINGQIAQINATIKETNRIQNQYTHWTPLLAEFINAIPEPLIIHRLEIHKKDKTFSISGIAPTRDDLFALQTQLVELEMIKSLEIPIDQIVEKENITFSVSGKLTP